MPVGANAAIEITAFRWVPRFAQGIVRDVRATANEPIPKEWPPRGDVRRQQKDRLQQNCC
jgi:hypothetical protein